MNAISRVAVPFINLDQFDFSVWTPIAEAKHPGHFYAGPRWTAVDGAPLTIAEADALVARGLLLKANRRLKDRTQVVVMVARRKSRDWPCGRMAVERSRNIAMLFRPSSLAPAVIERNPNDV